MQGVTYTRVFIEGFQSFGNPVKFTLDKGAGIYLIKGRNGVGKSTVFNAIYWAEFGSNLKKSVETWKENRPDSYRGTRVIVERTIGEYDYMIARHLNFSGNTKGLKGGDKLMIFKKHSSKAKFEQSDLVGEGLHKSDMQKLINSQIGMDDRAFLSSILFGQRLKSLVESKNEDKRKLFEDLFELAFVEDAKVQAKNEELRISTELATIKERYENSDSRIEELVNYYDDSKDILDNFEKDKKIEIELIQSELDSEKAELTKEEKELGSSQKKLKSLNDSKEEELEDELDKYETELESVLNDLKSSKGRVGDLETSIDKCKTTMQRIEAELKNVSDTCPSCNQPLKKADVDSVKKNLKSQIAKEKEAMSILETVELVKEVKSVKLLEDKVNEYKSKRDLASKNLKEFKESNKDLYALKASIPHLEKAVANRKLSIKKVEDRLEKEKNKKAPEIDLEAILLEVKEEKKFKSDSKEKLEKLQTELDEIKWWITKGFSSSGLKAFVFNAMLTQLNLYAQTYASRLGFGVEFTIDMSKASKPFQTLVYKGNEVKDYEDLSGGQKQRVDICIAFAMHDLITRNKSDINILIVDELFEGLDSAGVEAAFDLIRQKAENKSVYVITHSDIIDGLNCKHISLESDELGNTYFV